MRDPLDDDAVLPAAYVERVLRDYYAGRLGGEDLVEFGVDEGERHANRHRGVVGFEDAGMAGEDRHTGANSGLREVHGGDVFGLKAGNGGRQVGVQSREETAPGGRGCVGRSLSTGEHDAGGQRV